MTDLSQVFHRATIVVEHGGAVGAKVALPLRRCPHQGRAATPPETCATTTPI